MQLKYIPINELKVSRLNMRHGRKAPDISDIYPSIKSRGVLQTMLVPSLMAQLGELNWWPSRFPDAGIDSLDDAGAPEESDSARMFAGPRSDDAEAGGAVGGGVEGGSRRGTPPQRDALAVTL